ncbi:DUF6266 family protein [Pedobacter sp. JCM 36344]|uniref:DUF6266 family protein n=1 Tax=Pedobacter sp. JCM 36344 TaxID=3374280 RepID=UPI00397AE254
MGKIKKGILGGVSGKVGAVVGAHWRGIDYLRGLPKLQTKPRTDLQHAQTSKLTLFRGFLLGIASTVEKCFQNHTKYTEMNAALSYNMTHAVAGSYPEFEVDFPALLFAKGELLGSWGPKALSKETSQLTVCWKNRPFSNMSAAGDKVQVIMYCVETEEFHIYEQIGTRSDKSVTLAIEGGVSGHTVHCYLSFYSEAFKISSTNEYIGEIPVK